MRKKKGIVYKNCRKDIEARVYTEKEFMVLPFLNSKYKLNTLSKLQSQQLYSNYLLFLRDYNNLQLILVLPH